jgi:acetyl esterase/lipase
MSYADFDKKTVTYKTVQKDEKSYPILLDVLVPKTLPPGTHPVNIRFHGGFLVLGSRDYAIFMPPRHLQNAVEKNIIIVTPDYRLLPECHVSDILDDVEDIWKWVNKDAKSTNGSLAGEEKWPQAGLKGCVERMTNNKSSVDLGRIMVSGESAG